MAKLSTRWGIMPDGIFVGYKDYGWGAISEPQICFYNIDDAVEWKESGQNREFKLVPLV